MTNLSEQTVLTPAAKKTVKYIFRDTLKPRLKFTPSLIWTRGIKMHTHFLDLQNIFYSPPHLFELRKAFCTPSGEKKLKNNRISKLISGKCCHKNRTIEFYIFNFSFDYGIIILGCYIIA